MCGRYTSETKVAQHGSFLHVFLPARILGREGAAGRVVVRERGFANPHIHTSGHADAKSLQSIVRHVDPGLLIPIHTTVPERFATLFPDRTIRCPQDNESIEL